MVTNTVQNIYPDPVECVITCYEDGSICINDKLGNEIAGVQESEYFKSYKVKQITEIQESMVDIKIVESDGTICKVRKIGDLVYKIPCDDTKMVKTIK
jgi:hypothetical protein